MPNFLTGGLSKLKGSRQRAADAAKQPPETPLKYEGRLTASDFALSEGSAFGLGAVQPQTLAFDPHTQLIALCSKEGHVHFWGADLELCLRNPLAPVRVEFLLFPRPGFVLALGLAAAPGSSTSTWVAQWWDVQAGAQRTLSQALSLRFGITCATVAEGSALVFLGTDVGDVRAFDAGATPGMADYCVPWPRLLPSTDHSADARPCPVTALDVAPNGVAEILVGGAEGCIALWGLERHKNLRTFDAGGPVSSMTWHVGGASFVVAVRSELLVFQKSGSAIVSKVPLPGGPAQSVTLLRWSSVEGHRRRVSFPPNAAEVPGMHGDLLLRRGGPNPAVVNVRGPNWSEVDAVLNDAEAIGGAIVCSAPASEDSGLGGSASCRKSLGCVVPPWAIAASGVDEELTEDSQAHMQVMELYTSSPLVLAVVGDPCMRVVVATLPPAPRLVWPAAWGSMELAGMTVQSLPDHRRIISRPLDSSSIADGTPRDAQGGGGPCVGGGEEDGEETEAAACAGAAEADEPPPIPSREDSAMEQEVDDVQDKQRFAQLAEAMLARRFANFVSFLDGREAPPHEAAFASAWNSMAGGWLGTVCTGHCDGTLRIWLRAHAELLLLHTVSVVPLAPLPWRPQLEVPKGGNLPPEARFLPAEALARHDGVDSCPAVPVPGACDGDKASSITAVAFSPHEGVLAAATASGCVAIFEWRDSSSAMPLGEFARWKASVINPPPGDAAQAGPGAANTQVSEPEDSAEAAATEEAQKEGQEEEVSASASAIQAEAVDPAEVQEAELQTEVESRPPEATEEEPAARKEEAAEEEVSRAADAVQEGAEAADAKKQVIEEGRSDSKAADPLADAGAALQQVEEPSPPMLPGGFVCCLHVQEHASAVNRLQLVEVGTGVLHAVSSDTLGRLCVQEVATGSMLFSGFPGSESSVGEAATGVAQAKKTPPQVSVESFVFSSQVLHLPTEALPGSTAEAKANKSSSSSAGKSKHDSQVAAAQAAAEMALQLMQDGGAAGDSSLPGPSGAYIIAMSTGELRQLSVPDMRLLDGRIQQLRLPSIPAGSVLLQHLTASYMVIAQANAVHILLRPAPKILAAPRTTSFEGRAVSAHFLQVQGEDCLYVLMATLTVQIFALPSMQLLTSVQTGPAADPFLVQLPSQRQTSTAASGTSSASPASSAAFSPGERGGCIGQDGYVAFRSGGSVGSRIWLAACQAEAAALDSAAWMMPIARIKQAAAPIPVPTVSAEPAPSASSSAGLGGFFGSLLGGGHAGPRGVRASVRPSTPLPPELDASRIDKARGLPPAWQEYGSSSAKAPQPPPPPRKDNAKGDLRSQLFGGAAPRAGGAEPRPEGKTPSEKTSALGSAQAAASEAQQKALERGDKMNQLAQKSEQLQKDSEDFLKMAKQLNSRNQNRWF